MFVRRVLPIAISGVMLLVPHNVHGSFLSAPSHGPAPGSLPGHHCPPNVCRHKSKAWQPSQRGGSSLLAATIPPSSSKDEANPSNWVTTGISAVYLAHFASLYTQLPGLFGQTGLLPIIDRLPDLTDKLWALDWFASPEFGMELFAGLGILISAAQLIWSGLRRGVGGVVSYTLLWILWHDLVFSGGRFMEYQMDLLLLDAAPLTVLASSGLLPEASNFGFRWLLSRLYIGAGAVKLLSCDASWRSLSAVHWHFQSQPLPNPVGAWAYLHLPEGVAAALTWITLVVEMAAPFLFLAPNREIRRVAFGLNVLIMVGIASFGNFGCLQILLIVIGFALLDEDDLSSVTDGRASSLASGGAVALALGGAYWAIGDIGATCLDTLDVEPLVYGLVVLGALAASLPLFSLKSSPSPRLTAAEAVTSLAIVAGSASVMSNPLGAFLPSFDFLNFGAVPYGLFATISGVGGRPVAAIEAAVSQEGPWIHVPLLYQVNDPDGALPLIFPHFPRVDWTLWFLPFGESGLWIARLFHGITVEDPAILRLLDESKLRNAFPDQPPAIVRVIPRKYELDTVGRSWIAKDDPKYAKSPVLATFKKGAYAGRMRVVEDAETWPSAPILRSISDASRPEYFVWGCLGTAGTVGQAVALQTDWSEDDENTK